MSCYLWSFARLGTIYTNFWIVQMVPNRKMHHLMKMIDFFDNWNVIVSSLPQYSVSKKNKVKGKRNRCNMQYLRQIRLYVLVMSHRRFRVNPHTIVAWVSRNSLLEAGAKSEVCMTATGLELTTTYFVNEHSTI